MKTVRVGVYSAVSINFAALLEMPTVIDAKKFDERGDLCCDQIVWK